MAEEIKRLCDSCRFWQPEEGHTDDTGQCRKNPPAVDVVEAALYGLAVIRLALKDDTPAGLGEEANAASETKYAVWPVTFDDHWCGGWEFGAPRQREPEDGLPPEMKPDTSTECRPNG